MKNVNYKLNNRVEGSLKCILGISLPLILSALSDSILHLIDRMILAYYSLDSMNAAAISGNLACVFSFMFVAIAGVAEIYVGQNNGAKNYDKLAVPTWQMIYLAAIAVVVFFPIGYFAEYINLLPECYLKEGVEYQRPLTYLCFIPILKVAFAAFFIGQGKTKIITVSVFAGSAINAILDYFLIFGYKDIVPELGCKGAAIATIIAEIIQVLILAKVFFNKSNRINYKTAKSYKFNKEIFFGCFKIGSPMAIGRMIELLAWYVVYATVSHTSKEMATIQGICVTIYLQFAFVCEGLNKSASTISANLIGSRDLEAIKKTFKTFIKITLFMGGIIMIPLIIFPNYIFMILDMLRENVSGLYGDMSIIFKILVLNITLEALGSVTWGFLLSGGDTKYPIIANLSTLWGFVVIPLCVLFYMDQLTSAVTIYWLTTLWGISSFFLIYKRFKSLKWYTLLVSKSD